MLLVCAPQPVWPKIADSLVCTPQSALARRQMADALVCHGVAATADDGGDMKMWFALVVLVLLVLGLYVFIVASMLWLLHMNKTGTSKATQDDERRRGVAVTHDERRRGVAATRIFTAGGGECFHVDSKCDGLKKATTIVERRPCRVCCM